MSVEPNPAGTERRLDGLGDRPTHAALVWTGAVAAPAPVVAVHGWQDTAASLAPIAARLAAGPSGRRVTAIDLAGHGGSGRRPRGVSYAFLDWVLDVHAVLAAVAPDGPVDYVGHSLGAALGGVVAGVWPERVRRLVLLDGFTPRTQPADEAPARLREFAERAAAAPSANRVFADRDAALARLAEARGLSADVAAQLVDRAIEPVGDGGVTWRLDPRVRVGPALRLSAEQIDAYLARVRCPVLLVRPRGGWPIDGSVEKRLACVFPQLERVDVDGGHYAHLEHVDPVASAIRSFLDAPA